MSYLEVPFHGDEEAYVAAMTATRACLMCGAYDTEQAGCSACEEGVVKSSVELVGKLRRLERKLMSPDVVDENGQIAFAADEVLRELESQGAPMVVNEQGDLYHWAVWNDRRNGRAA